ncbi:MAG: DNA alkylation repair protein [Clostridia bacterium]|nr:DNA alkylation repair protein [Clostridia bacterium]
MNEEIEKRIFELADTEYKEFHSGLCPNTNNIVGVRVPVLRNYAKELAKSDFRTYLNNAKDDYYEETMLQGMVIGLSKMDIEERLNYIKKFVPKINNWAICDVFCAGLKFTNKNKEIVWEFLKVYNNSVEEFELRFFIVMLLDFYITDKYINEVISILDNIKHEGYYVKMAIAWTISVAYIKYPETTIKYLMNNTLDDFTYNKALQKIIESYRVSNSDKKIIRSMKRK